MPLDCGNFDIELLDQTLYRFGDRIRQIRGNLVEVQFQLSVGFVRLRFVIVGANLRTRSYDRPDLLAYPSMRCPILASAVRSPVCKSARVSIPLQSMPKSTMASATASERPVTIVCAPFSRTAWMVLSR
jgi:hypothetical protein